MTRIIVKKMLLAALLLLSRPAWTATIQVDSPADSGAHTLRQAILNANGNTGTVDTIVFKLGPDVPIQLASQIDITGPVIINGSGVTITAVADFAYPLLVLTGDSGGSLIRDLCLTRGENGLLIESSGNTVWGCCIGVRWDSGPDPNVHGIYITGSQNKIGGGPAPYMQNTVSGNSQNAIYAFNTSRLVIQNNRIGTRVEGTTARSNLKNGIYLQNCTQCLIGGDRGANEDNLISGNIEHGIYIQGGEYAGNSICGNIIGLRSNQASAIGNTGAGIRIYGSGGNIIGLPQAGYGNIVSGNVNRGIDLWTAGSVVRNTVVRNNLIGLNESGLAIPNNIGVYLYQTQNCTIGGFRNDSYLHRNVISGNSGQGIYAYGNNQGMVISGNYIGTSLDGSTARGNYRGIQLAFALNIAIGGVHSLTGGDTLGNVISGNTEKGIELNTSCLGNTIAGNYIGVDAAGTTFVSNGTYGIYVNANSNGNVIGGLRQATQTLGNVISGNTSYGITLANSHTNYLAGNLIGLNAAGTGALPNSRGIWANGSGNQIGGPSSQERNYIGGNFETGLSLSNAAPGNRIQNNYFGINVAGGDEVPNGLYDLGISGAQNLVSDNYMGGYVQVLTSNAWGNTLVGNTIGERPGNFSTFPFYGVRISSSAHGNFIGQAQTGTGNYIRSATNTGVSIDGAATVNNVVWGNTIYDCTTPMALTNSGNAYKAAPVILTAVAQTVVSGTSAAGDYIEVFRAENLQPKGGAVLFLGYTTANGSGNWSLNPGSLATQGYYVSALATDANNNTSGFAANVMLVPAPTFTRTTTMTRTPTSTATPTITLTSTMSATITHSPTISSTHTVTPTITGTLTITATFTVTPTITPTPTITSTFTATPSHTPTPTLTTTPVNPLLAVDLTGKAVLAFPNPAKGQMTFVFHLDTPARVDIKLYNMAGERTAGLSGNFAAGRGQSLVWNLKDAAPGVYVARMFVNGSVKTTFKAVVVK